MNNLKKLLALLLALTVFAGLLAGCNGDTNSDDPAPSGNVDAIGGDDATGGESGDVPVGQTGVGAEGVGNYGGHLNVRTAGRPDGLDPLRQTGAWKYILTTCVFDSMLTRDTENNICPAVCDFELSEDMLDLKLWVRDGYTFSGDYGHVDIYDIEASFTRGLKKYPNISTYVAPYVASYKVENDGEKDILHVVFSEYKEKCLYYLAAFQTWWPVMPKEICEKYANSYIASNMEDAVGTGPYVFSDFQDSIQTTITKRDDYVPVKNTGTGHAGTKYGYMDSITFWYNITDASSAIALLNGDYDMTEVLPTEYKAMAEQQNLVLDALPSNQRTWIYFNTKGTNNVCAKYPSLRKAVLAAIDYEVFLDTVTDSSHILEGENSNMIMGDLYATDAFKNQDYYGPANQEVVDKYLAEAAKEGYTGEPVQIVYHNGRTDIPTLLCDAMKKAGIKYQFESMEDTTYNAFINEPSNNWDFYFDWTVTSYTPATLHANIIDKNINSAEVASLLKEMYSLDPTSDAYLAKWEEMANVLADECLVGYMSAIDWWWWHPETLNINDEGYVRYVFNTYWDDPENHPKK